MPLAIGFLLFSLGLVTVVGWWDAVLPFLKGFTTFSLLFWGLVSMLVGYSERKARREYKKALVDEPLTVPREAEL